MIDHVLGRPSTQFRKIQVFAVVLFWFLYLLRGNKHGPPILRLISSNLSRKMTSWQTTVMTLLTLYVSSNFAKLVGLESPEPLANLYSRSYFRATWITTALDAGFWTAMNIKRPWMRDICSMLFTAYYLVAAGQADEKVRRVRATLTVEHLRVSWNKATTPYLSTLAKLLRPRLASYPPVAIRIPRPRGSSYTEPALGWLYFNGPLSALQYQENIVLDIPGGGFVAMNPRTADDKLLAWAGRTGVPVLSLDYKKAPEYPYPYALNECYDVYHTIVTTRGRCLGMSGKTIPRIILTGDSAGGNLAAGLTLMILQSGSTNSRDGRGEDVLPVPAGLVLIYPALDMNIGSWMTDEQMSLIRDRDMRQTNRNVLRRKSEDYYKLTPATPHQSDEDCEDPHSVIQDNFGRQHGGRRAKDLQMTSADSANSVRKPVPGNVASKVVATAERTPPHQINTRLAVSSMISYFNDRILTPEMMRAMIILYIGPYNRPDFSTDFLLSPLLAPDSLLARFPKTYFLTGERDPLVDDTVIFAGRIRQAKLHHFRERQDLSLEKSNVRFDEKKHVEVALIPGISHGFLNFVPVFPEGWRQIFRCATWIRDLFDVAKKVDRGSGESSRVSLQRKQKQQGHEETRKPMQDNIRHHRRGGTGESSGDDDKPLEMTTLNPSKPSPRRDQSTASPSQSSSPSSSPPSSPPSAQPQPQPSQNERSSTLSPSPAANGDVPLKKCEEDTNNKPGSSAAPLLPIFPSDSSTNVNVDSIDSDFSAIAQGQAVQKDNESQTAQTSARRSRLQQKRQGQQLELDIPHLHREKSLTKLSSEEDLLGRRMEGLAGGLMGLGEGAKTP